LTLSSELLDLTNMRPSCLDHGILPNLGVARAERVFGSGHAAANPQLVIAVMHAASSDWAATRLAVAIERVAEALLVEENDPGRLETFVRPHGLVRP
jgi:hypothetical protein